MNSWLSFVRSYHQKPRRKVGHATALNSNISHLLGKNFNLSMLTLKSNLKKLQKNSVHLKLITKAIKEQERESVLEKIENLDQFL